MTQFQPISSSGAPRFAGIKTFMKLPYLQIADLKQTSNIDFAIIGIPFDTASTFRVGSRFAPSAIRDISASIRSYNINLSDNIFDILSGVDLGDLSVVPGYIEESYSRIQQELQIPIELNIIPICIGGDHSITLAELRSLAKKHGPVALVQFDAHMDTMNSYLGKQYSHATTFRRACEEGLIDTKHSIQIGIRSAFKTHRDVGIQVITSDMARERGLDWVSQQMMERVGDKKAFLSFDIDFVDPAYAPGTGTMEICGFTSYETIHLIRNTKGIHFVGFDLVEVIPTYDPTQITSFLAANIVQEFLGLIALNHKKIHDQNK